jgi:hypothetical protein
MVQQRERVIGRHEAFVQTERGRRCERGDKNIQLKNGEQVNSECVKRLVWGMWRTASKYSEAEKKKDYMRKNWYEKATEDKQVRLREAHLANDYREVWNVARKIGGMHVGKGKIRLRAAKSCDPSIDEWVEAMGKDGPSGGCKAVEQERGKGEQDSTVREDSYGQGRRNDVDPGGARRKNDERRAAQTATES